MKTIIKGVPPSKSNSYRIARNRLFKTRVAQAYEALFQAQCTIKNKNIETEHAIHIAVYYDNKRSDLDGAFKILMDSLQKCYTIKNDNRTVIILSQKLIDKKNPRVEIEIIPLPKYDYGTLTTSLSQVLSDNDMLSNTLN